MWQIVNRSATKQWQRCQRNEVAAMEHRSLCPINLALDLLGEKWSLLVIRDAVFCGAQYFKDFKAAQEIISTNIVADRLNSLENNGF